MTQALRYASIFAVAAMLATSFGTLRLHAQGAATSASDADAKKKADAAKAAKAAADKKPAAGGTQNLQTPTGY